MVRGDFPFYLKFAPKVTHPWAMGAPQYLGFPFNIHTIAEASDFKFGSQLGFAKAHHKSHP